MPGGDAETSAARDVRGHDFLSLADKAHAPAGISLTAIGFSIIGKKFVEDGGNFFSVDDHVARHLHGPENSKLEIECQNVARNKLHSLANVGRDDHGATIAVAEVSGSVNVALFDPHSRRVAAHLWFAAVRSLISGLCRRRVRRRNGLYHNFGRRLLESFVPLIQTVKSKPVGVGAVEILDVGG